MSGSAPVTVGPGVVLALFAVALIPFLPLLVSGRWDWWEGWVYAIVSILGFAAARILAVRRHPGLFSERARSMRHENAEPWDRALAPLVGVGSALIPLVAGLDAHFHWSSAFGLPAKIVSFGIIVAGYLLGSYALVENAFFSGVVRIQTDRGHAVVSSGPYRWMRHPGYSGAVLAYLATPVFLDSMWAFVPALFLTIALVIRTALEDATLQQSLEGYREYASHVHHRLVPGVW